MVYLANTPADIIQQLMIDLALGTAVSDNLAWPVYSGNLPTSPDDAIAVTDTEPLIHGRSHIDGETQEHFGFQVRVRTASPTEGYIKAAEIAAAFDEDVLRQAVDVGAENYEIQAITRRSGVIRMGKEPTSSRNLWSVNFTASITGLGTGS